MVANNNSIIGKAAIKVWDLVEDAEKHQIETLIDTLTKRETQKLQLDCTGCQTGDEMCNCTFKGIMTENSFNIDLIIGNQLNSRWCPSNLVTSSFFHCDPFHSINASMLCDGYSDCPNGLDETLGLCSPDEQICIIPVLTLYIVTFCLALFFHSNRKQESLRRKPRPEFSTDSLVTKSLKDLRNFAVNPNEQNENTLENNIRRMGSLAKLELLKISYNIEFTGEASSELVMKTVVGKVFATKSKAKVLLTLVKNSQMPTAFKTRVLDLIKMGSMTKLKNDIEEAIPPKETTYLTLTGDTFNALLQIVLLPSQDIKDLATIATLINFHLNVIQERTNMIDDVPLNTITSLLLGIFVAAQLLKLLVSSSTELPIQVPRCFPLGFKCDPRWIPFFTESYLCIRRIQQTWRIFWLKLEILQKLEGLKEIEGDTTSTWEDIQVKSHQINTLSTKIERGNFATKKVKVVAVLGDILQGAVLLVLILRTDLRLRGTLGLANFAGRLNVATRDSDIPGTIFFRLSH